MWNETCVPVDRANTVRLLNMLVKDKAISKKTMERALWLYDHGAVLTWKNVEMRMVAKHRPAVRYRLVVTVPNPIIL